MAWNKADYMRNRSALLRGIESALSPIYRKQHKTAAEITLCEVAGSLCWGRFDGESKPSESAYDIAAGYGQLVAWRIALMLLARRLGLGDVDRALRLVPTYVSPANEKDSPHA